MSSNPPKPPRLIVANREALNELEAAGLRKKMLSKYDVTLPSLLKEGRSKDDPPPDQQIFDQLKQRMQGIQKLRDQEKVPHFKDVSDEDLATAALLVQGAFGDGARVVGLPEVLNREVEWIMLSRDREQVSVMDRRALSSEALSDEAFSDSEGARSQAREAIEKERRKPKGKDVERQWDKERNPQLTPFNPLPGPSFTEYYKRMGRVALDDGSIHRTEALEHLAKSRYNMLLDFEQQEIPRQVGVVDRFLKANTRYKDISQIPREEIRDPRGDLRKEYVDEDIAKRKQDFDEYNDPGTRPTRKKHLEMEMVKGRHLTPPNHQKLGSQNNAFGTISPDKKLEGMLLTQMEKYNDSRYPTVPLEILR
jgi:hypothetical protein